MWSSAVQHSILLLSLTSSFVTARALVTVPDGRSRIETPLASIGVVGIGVTSRNAASEWYSRNVGVQYLVSLPVSSIGLSSLAPYDENIGSLGFNSMAMALMQWSEVPARNVKDLPVLLQLTVPDAQVAQAKVLANGGSIWTGQRSTPTEGAFYAKDPDGYLLELIQTDESKKSNSTSLSLVGVGVSNLEKASAWFSHTMRAEAMPLRKSEAWDSVTINSTDGRQIMLMDWHETPRRSTFDLPIKLVMVSWQPIEYMRAMTSAGAKTQYNFGLAGFLKTPEDEITIEVN